MMSEKVNPLLISALREKFADCFEKIEKENLKIKSTVVTTHPCFVLTAEEILINPDKLS